MKNKNGFTLIELLVVIAIIGILAAIIAPNAFKAIEKAKCARAISDAKTLKTAATVFYGDTGVWPHGPGSHSSIDNYTDPNPFFFVFGTEGWDGPYLDKWNFHPWGGMERWSIMTVNGAGDSRKDAIIVFDDDHDADQGDNSGKIPVKSIEYIDRTIDDGDLTTGYVRGNASGFSSAYGEMVIVLVEDIEQ